MTLKRVSNSLIRCGKKDGPLCRLAWGGGLETPGAVEGGGMAGPRGEHGDDCKDSGGRQAERESDVDSKMGQAD
jgi:hypothetical protein